MTNPLQALGGLGQSVWLDSIRRSYLGPEGYLAELIAAGEIDGLTSNPTIFEQALATDGGYAAQLAELRGAEPRTALWALMQRDVVEAADLFRPMYEESGGAHGLVSIEIDPAKAFDTEETVAEALLLYRQLDRPNIMVKVPGTEAGLAAVTRLITEGVNVNVTLLFSVERYGAVIDAFLEGLRWRAQAGNDLSAVASVASFFVSRVDGKVDARLPEGHPLRGTAAIANARLAHRLFRDRFGGDGFAELAAAGARAQRPLWASTSTKDPAYRDVVYVEELAGPDTVNTMPEATLDAMRDHGVVADRLNGTGEAAQATLDKLAGEGIDLGVVTKELEAEGVEKFVASFEQAVAAVGEHLA